MESMAAPALPFPEEPFFSFQVWGKKLGKKHTQMWKKTLKEGGKQKKLWAKTLAEGVTAFEAVAAEVAAAGARAVEKVTAKAKAASETRGASSGTCGASGKAMPPTATFVGQYGVVLPFIRRAKACQSRRAPGLEEDVQGKRHEAAAYYYVSRLCTDESSQLGLASTAFVDAFNARHGAGLDCYLDSPPEEGRHALAMREALKAIAGLRRSIEVVVGGEKEGAAALEALAPWLHAAVERCVFAHVGSTIWDLYEERYAGADEAYAKKARALHREAPEALLFRLGVSAALSPMHRRGATSPNASSPTLQQPYAPAVEALSRLGSLLRSAGHPSPGEVARLLAAALLDMRTCALEATRGASELVAMDDVLPVFVYVLARSHLRCPLALAAYAHDALNREARLGADGWAVSLLESAASHVAYDLEEEDLCTPTPTHCDAIDGDDMMGKAQVSASAFGCLPSPARGGAEGSARAERRRDEVPELRDAAPADISAPRSRSASASAPASAPDDAAVLAVATVDPLRLLGAALQRVAGDGLRRLSPRV